MITPTTLPPWPPESLEDALSRYSSKDKMIILAMIDEGVINDAINFYLTSILPFNLKYYLFVSLNTKACQILLLRKISCYIYTNESSGEHSSTWDTEEFSSKMNIRSRFTYEALQKGYSILQTDVDMLFFKNPFAYFSCEDCFIEAMEDCLPGYINAGFMLIKSSPETIELYSYLVTISKSSPLTEDQSTINKLVKALSVKYKILNINQFQCGKLYYEIGKRGYADISSSCPECVVIHNNWMVTMVAKAYRFKEMLQWMYDENGYYSSTKSRYLLLECEVRQTFWLYGYHFLQNALALSYMLGRILILPKFFCDDDMPCPLYHHIRIKNFDEVFKGHYREHLFLNHPSVPAIIKSDLLDIGFLSFTDDQQNSNATVNVTSREISKYLSKDKSASILRLSFNNNTFFYFDDKTEDSEFRERISKGIVKGNYKQI